MDMYDLNLVLVEGVIIGNVVHSEAPDGKKALNFTIESKRSHAEKGDQFYKHQIVAWDRQIEKMGAQIVNGAFCRVRGHLQQGRFNYIDAGVSKSFEFDKVAADFIEVTAP